MPALPTLFLDAVRHNCDVSDARHAGSYSLCVYLMHMREYFRWERQLGPDVVLGAGAVGEWVHRRESYWATLEDASYRPLPLPGQQVDAFDVDAVNTWLVPLGYGYSAGVGRFGKPIFSVGCLSASESGEGYRLLCTDTEKVREMIAPPAMTRGDTIWIRRESLRRALWEMIEEWQWKKPRNALSRALDSYGFTEDAKNAMEQMVEAFSETAILHELGERVCGEQLGSDWEDMLSATEDRATEALMRTVRDNLADCLMVLPALLAEKDQASLHFYFATMTGLRRQLFPALVEAYEEFLIRSSASRLKQVVREGARHWLEGASHLLEAYRRGVAGSDFTLSSEMAERLKF
ncbi:MAG TPA: hypothetical protein DHW07_00135 [Gammaproteobacteria bacterium]|nr:hypothetical protein [Gammaproteobacteria bacterium]